jgi:putative transposase
MFEQLNTSAKDAHITQATLRCEVYGSERFHYQISALISRTTKLTSHGGDRKSEAYHNHVG